MKFNHMVKVGNVYYPAGTEVPVGEPKKELPPKKVEEVKAEVKAEAEEKVEEPKKVAYTKRDIMRMTVAELQRVGKENGVVDADELNGAQLKSILTKQFGL